MTTTLARRRPIRFTRVAAVLLLGALCAQLLPAVGYPAPGHKPHGPQEALHAPGTPRPAPDSPQSRGPDPHPEPSSPSPTHAEPVQGV